MDQFTERILERARERQRKLLEYNDGEAATPLRESNIKAASTPSIASPPHDFAELQKAKRKNVNSDSDLSFKPTTDNDSLKGTVSEGNLPKLVRQNSKTRISSHMPGSPQLQLKTLNIQQENFNMEIKLSSTENVRIEVELQEESGTDDEGKENVLTHEEIEDGDSSDGQSVMREHAKKRLQRLGTLYAGGDDAQISSPIHRTEETFLVESEPSKKITSRMNTNIESSNSTTTERKGLRGLAALAKNINQWEDNLSVSKKETDEPKASTQKRSWKPPAPRPPIASSRSTENVPSKSSTPRPTKPQAPKPPIDVGIKASVVAETFKVASPAKSPTKSKSNESITKTPKQLNLDPTLMKTLESQGFTRTTSNSRLIYNYDAQNHKQIKTAEITTPTKISKTINSNDCIVEESEPEEPEMPISKPERTVSQTSINKIAEGKSHEILRSPVKSTIKGSAIADRAAMFEPTSSPIKSNNKDPALLSVSERKALFEKNKGAAPVPKAPISLAAPINTEKCTPKTQNNPAKPANAAIASPVKAGKSISTSSLNDIPKSPKKGDKFGSMSSINTFKSPASRPPIRPNDRVDASAYRVAPGESGGIASKMAALFQNKSTISQQQIENSIREQRQKEMDVLLNRFQKNKQTFQNEEALHSESESDSDDDQPTETTAMITTKPPQIIKKFEEIPPPPPPPPGPSGKKRRSGGRRCSKEDSPKVAAVLGDVKRIKVSNSNKPGRLYPCLSDIEVATETETEQNTATPSPNNSSFEDEYCYESDADEAETSFGREVLETVCKNQTPQKRTIYEESTESDMSDVLDDMDDYLDEALAYDAADKSGPTPPKQSRSISLVNNVAAQPSNSFHYKNYSPVKGSPQKNKSPENDFKTPSKVVCSRKSDELPTFVVDGDNVLPLTHTVSFYRRQQTQGSKTPVRQISRQPAIDESSEISISSAKSNESTEVQNKIQDMLEEMTRQQTIISQTSQALNLCYSTPEFTGSTEQVEAEKVLLLATHRRSAAQREMERLSVLRTLHSENKHTENIPLEKGTLTISNIVLPLKRDYVRALNATGGKGHHVMCLIKCAEQVHSTKLVSTVATNDRNPNLELSVPGTIRLNNIYSNFTVQFEVYCLQAQEEMLPHEVKYHIGNKKSNNKLTPKKMKPDSRLVRPPKESPGGPQAVRSPTFALMGYVVFALQAVNRKNWTLNNTPSMSPLEGIVEMRVKCELSMTVQQRGFLTMFEDVSGFGAWHRRWCLLKGHLLSYWKYPEEERKKAPIDSIDLTRCITQLVGPVRRDICARLHTILLETTRPAQPQDKDSLVMECTGDTTIIRHLLSADTKEERVEWCTMFNKALTAIKISQNSK